ncbi:MAG: hypothetical protein FWC60_01170 [Firmicutes bacterium]|nr:hypothetical protein [Bacillota bacterium]
MPKKKNKPEIIITPSGHEVDKDLAKVPIKVSPPLQALLANQMELIEMAEGKASRNLVFIEQHKLEMLQFEEEVAGAFSVYLGKREKAREKRLEKPSPAPDLAAADVDAADGWAQMDRSDLADRDDYSAPPFETLPADDIIFGAEPAGLPSSKYEARRPAGAPYHDEPSHEEADVRRIALGAAIKALQAFLNRELSEAEMQSLEAQVDAYLE